MNDYIDRQAAIEHLKKRLYETALNNVTEHPYYEEMADNRVSVWLKEVPSVQPQKIRGKWIKLYKGNYKCSECGDWWGNDDNNMVENFQYCPNCGADMRG